MSEEPIRISESGDIRITESGSIRVLETFPTAKAETSASGDATAHWSCSGVAVAVTSASGECQSLQQPQSGGGGWRNKKKSKAPPTQATPQVPVSCSSVCVLSPASSFGVCRVGAVIRCASVTVLPAAKCSAVSGVELIGLARSTQGGLGCVARAEVDTIDLEDEEEIMVLLQEVV